MLTGMCSYNKHYYIVTLTVLDFYWTLQLETQEVCVLLCMVLYLTLYCGC
jgi:hypothetical protein